MQDKILELLTKEDDVTWKAILTNLVKSEEMDPWDVDISMLAKRFLDTVKELQRTDFRVSGKVVLASAILLRMKSVKLLEEYMKDLDTMIAAGQANDADQFYDELETEFMSQGIIENRQQIDRYTLIPRTPQPRKRKVSMYDLIDALNKALEVQDRRTVRRVDYKIPKVEVPNKKWDLGEMVEKIYHTIQDYYAASDKTLTFSALVPTGGKEEKVMTFLPLLHLSHLRKINLDQTEHFGRIDISLLKVADPDEKIAPVPQ